MEYAKAKYADAALTDEASRYVAQVYNIRREDIERYIHANEEEGAYNFNTWTGRRTGRTGVGMGLGRLTGCQLGIIVNAFRGRDG